MAEPSVHHSHLRTVNSMWPMKQENALFSVHLLKNLNLFQKTNLVMKFLPLQSFADKDSTKELHIAQEIIDRNTSIALAKSKMKYVLFLDYKAT